jgi:hypothetical protein
LLEILPPSADWSNDLKNADILSPYAVTARYPGKAKVTKKEALRAVSIAETARKTVIKALIQEGLKITPRAKAP